MSKLIASECFLVLLAKKAERKETVKIFAILDIFLYYVFGSQRSQSRNVPVLKVVEFNSENL